MSLLKIHRFSQVLVREYNFFNSSSADSLVNLCKQFGHRSDPTKRRAYSVSKLFDTLMVFLNFFSDKVDLGKK